MSRFGILTFFDAKNYGAALQAFALQRVIKDIGYESEFIRFIEEKRELPDQMDWSAYLRIFKNNNYSLKNYMMARSIEHSKYNRFDEFCERYMKLSHRAYYKLEDLRQYETEYDGYICGSDMVWSDIGQNLNVFFLMFTSENKRISYAPSITGREDESEEERCFYRDRLNGIKYLSCREKSGVQYIKKTTGRDAALVLDPTLLLTKDQWRRAFNLDHHMGGKPYILCYMFGGTSKKFQKKIDILKRNYDMSVRYIPVSNRELQHELRDGVIPDYGPQEFVQMFYQAGMVLTNSYHGLLFSIIMEKPFLVFHREKNNEWHKHEERLANVLQQLHLENRYFYENESFEAFDVKLEYSFINKRIDEQRYQSIQYLQRALFNVSQNNRTQETEKSWGDDERICNVGELDKNRCTGCSACMFLCPTACISMNPNTEGFFEPVIEEDQCIRCKQCVAHCPALSPSTLRRPIKTYCGAGTEDLVKNSASGGAFVTIAKWFIENKSGVVYGAVLDLETKTCHHMAANNLSELVLMQNSKYVQSNLFQVMEACKENVINGKYVLFSGTPCQIDALYKYLGKEYDHLYTMDLICHGTPSPMFFKKYLLNQMGDKIKNFRFRHKFDIMNKRSAYDIYVQKENWEEMIVPGMEDVYYKLFLKGASYRESCYCCYYATDRRVGDITIGDCDSWRIHTFFEKGEVTSAILLNTKKAVDLWNQLSFQFKYTELNYEEECIANHQLRRPTVRPKQRDDLYGDLSSLSWKNFVKKYGNNGVKQKIKHIVLCHKRH